LRRRSRGIIFAQSYGRVLQVTFIKAAGLGFEEAAITADPVMRKKQKGDQSYGCRKSFHHGTIELERGLVYQLPDGFR